MIKKVCIGLMFLLTLTFLLCILFIPKQPKIIDYKSYIVASGDTLWTIACKYPHKDIRELVQLIEKTNNIDARISIGQVLEIPIIETR